MSANTFPGFNNKKKNNFSLMSFNTVSFGDWLIKASCCNKGKILLILYNEKTHTLDVRYFDDEYQANIFITCRLEKL
jgi:hypothetical protein